MGFHQHMAKIKKVNQNRKEQVFLFYSRLWAGGHALGRLGEVLSFVQPTPTVTMVPPGIGSGGDDTSQTLF
jgi:hypothetical protein